MSAEEGVVLLLVLGFGISSCVDNLRGLWHAWREPEDD